MNKDCFPSEFCMRKYEILRVRHESMRFQAKVWSETYAQYVRLGMSALDDNDYDFQDTSTVKDSEITINRKLKFHNQTASYHIIVMKVS